MYNSSMGIITGNSLKFGDLFCGPGGLSLGFEQAKGSGFYTKLTPVWSIDNHEDSCNTYKNNLCEQKNVKVYCKDIKTFNLEQLDPIDILAFGFPCNDFSLVGEKLGFKGEYGPLYSYGVKILNLLSPDCFIAENVTGLSSANSGSAFEKIKSDLRNAGYHIWVDQYKFEEFGIPQSRHRIIIVGFKKSLKANFIKLNPTYELVTSGEALNNIPEDASNNEYTKQSSKVVERLKYIKPGRNVWDSELPKRLQLNVKGARLSNIYKRLDPTKPAYTVTGSGGGGTHMYHWRENRALTNRERARLQTFPDDFLFCGLKESVRRQIGMAIPPKFGKILGNRILQTFCSVYEHNKNVCNR